MDTLIIQGSARGDGNTSRVVAHLSTELGASVIDLLDYGIHPFRYGGNYPTDDQFLEIIEHFVLQHPSIILASPVYWYTMSGLMKQFVDRFTDLLTDYKPLGRKLRGRQLGVVSCANDARVEPTFYTAFRLTAAYLGMDYGPEYHGWVGPDAVATVRKQTAVPRT